MNFFHTLYTRVSCDLQCQAIISLRNIKWMFFVRDTWCVFCKVGNKYTRMYSNDLTTSTVSHGRIYPTGYFMGFFLRC